MPKGVSELFEVSRFVGPIRKGVSQPKIVLERAVNLSSVPFDCRSKSGHGSESYQIVTMRRREKSKPLIFCTA
jgi:hypothetical protein